jgi:hypothetical protein
LDLAFVDWAWWAPDGTVAYVEGTGPDGQPEVLRVNLVTRESTPVCRCEGMVGVLPDGRPAWLPGTQAPLGSAVLPPVPPGHPAGTVPEVAAPDGNGWAASPSGPDDGAARTLLVVTGSLSHRWAIPEAAAGARIGLLAWTRHGVLVCVTSPFPTDPPSPVLSNRLLWIDPATGVVTEVAQGRNMDRIRSRSR